MNKSQFKKQLSDIEHDMSVENRMGDLRRARSVTVGTAFGGTTELMMRGNDSNVIWAILQPVEVIELIHQLAANVGCHIHLQPRNDFASWRDWKITPEEKKHLNGHPPFVNDMAPFQNIGQILPPPEQQPGLQPALMVRNNEDEQAVAVKESIKRTRAKRPTTPT